jgi:hypothetical protein
MLPRTSPFSICSATNFMFMAFGSLLLSLKAL